MIQAEVTGRCKDLCAQCVPPEVPVHGGCPVLRLDTLWPNGHEWYK